MPAKTPASANPFTKRLPELNRRKVIALKTAHSRLTGIDFSAIAQKASLRILSQKHLAEAPQESLPSEFQAYKFLTCHRSGRYLGRRNPEFISDTLAIHEPEKALYLLDMANQSTYAPMWLDLSADSLTALATRDPAGYFVYCFSELAQAVYLAPADHNWHFAKARLNRALQWRAQADAKFAQKLAVTNELLRRLHGWSAKEEWQMGVTNHAKNALNTMHDALADIETLLFNVALEGDIILLPEAIDGIRGWLSAILANVIEQRLDARLDVAKRGQLPSQSTLLHAATTATGKKQFRLQAKEDKLTTQALVDELLADWDFETESAEDSKALLNAAGEAAEAHQRIANLPQPPAKFLSNAEKQDYLLNTFAVGASAPNGAGVQGVTGLKISQEERKPFNPASAIRAALSDLPPNKPRKSIRFSDLIEKEV